MKEVIKWVEDYEDVESDRLIIRCKDCKFAHMTMKTSWREPECKYCDIWFPDEACYMDADYYCASAEKREVEHE